ncbi:MAG TPA: hypothetical protein VHF25_12400 [Nitriliruptorales bacterium]|nr:hypothetical protein [Nitriliruptorales bacterium]
MRVLLADEVGCLVRRVAQSPVARIWVVATLIAVVVYAGLSDVTPGPVAAEWVRLTAVTIIVGLAAAAVSVGARRWGRSRPAGGTVLTWVIVGSLATFVVIGLHQQTPGPVLDAPLRWTLAAVLLTGAAVWRGRTRRGR